MSKEVERRFIVSRFPEYLNPLKMVNVLQSYLLVEESDEIRIRSVVVNNEREVTYYITAKHGDGMVRDEYETEIPRRSYQYFFNLLNSKHPISKDIRVYNINGYKVEISSVDINNNSTNNDGIRFSDHSYYYAEVEFECEEEAIEFDANIIPNLIKEVTNDPSYNMKNYWKRTRS